jgi:hypothetical protein
MSSKRFKKVELDPIFHIFGVYFVIIFSIYLLSYVKDCVGVEKAENPAYYPG